MSAPAAPWRAGFGTGDLTVFEPGLGMFGWGHPRNVSERVATTLHARALVLEERATGRRVALVVCDLGMISEHVRRAVARRVCTPAHGLTDHDLMVSATHTHSGPSGFSTYTFYAFSGPGVSARVSDAIVDGVVAAVEAALAALAPARAWSHAGWLPVSEPVAFNRSIAAHARNPDATPVTVERSDEAVDRTMTVLRVESADGEPLGLVSWFAVHGTSVHSDNQSLHGDNKGYAAREVEARARAEGHGGFVAMFAQESAGDVSPNYRWDARRGLMVGRYDDDDASARFVGEVQARHARALWALARAEGDELRGPLTAAVRYRDFVDRAADARFAGGADARTASPRLGLAFTVGTLEGAGPFAAGRSLAPWFGRAQARRVRRDPTAWYAPHGNKFPLCDLGAGAGHQGFGVLPRDGAGYVRLIPLDRVASYFARAQAYPATRDVSWVPRYLPVQQVRIGSLVVGAVPVEPTTVSGQRLRQAMRDAWRGEGVTRVVLNGYANAYCSYLTTPEEYVEQAYEGASTLYGRWSLPVFCSEMAGLAAEMRAGRERATLGEVPPEIPLAWCLPA